MKTYKIGVVVYRNCTSSMVTGLIDILTLANEFYKRMNNKSLFRIELIGESRTPISSFSNITFSPHKTIQAKSDYSLVYVPGFIGDTDSILKNEKKIITWLSALAKKKRTILAAACNGNFLLAESGALENKKATTHWSLIESFRDSYSKIDLQPERIIVDNGNTISAAGVTAYFNLGLHIIQRFAQKELALSCAKVFLVDSGRRIQTPYLMYTTPRKHGDDMVLKVQDWLETNYKEPVSLESLAKFSRLGQKTLSRRFKIATGDTPLVYLQRLRIENAKRMLESTSNTFNEITWKVGYNDASSFQRLFKAETGLSPREYRMKFSMA